VLGMADAVRRAVVAVAVERTNDLPW